jgi:predicted PurR-regulated permease PerM
MLRDGKNFCAWLGKRIPFDKNVGERVTASFIDTTVASILATIAAGAAQSVVLFIAYLLLGVPGAYLAGAITFIFSWIPILGSTPVWIVGAIYLYAHDSPIKLILMIILGLIAGLVDNVVRPIVLKGRSDMHPLISLIAIFGGISFFGILGVFLGPILMAVMISLLQAWPEVAVRFGLLPKSANPHGD